MDSFDERINNIYNASIGKPFPYENRKDVIYNLYSDLSKDVYGFRMRYNWVEMSYDELKKLYIDLQEMVEREEREEQEAIDRVMEEQGIDRETYDRWIRDYETYEQERWSA